MRDDSYAPGAPRLGPYEDTPRLAVEALRGDVFRDATNRTVSLTANTATFPTVFGAGMTTTSVGDPLVGHLLDGRYQITDRLARGGMATVYRAIDTRLTRTVAVKIMHVGLGDDAEFTRKFDREARAAARLSHPCVVSVFDQGQDRSGPSAGGRPYIVMEYVEGQTLRDVLNRDAPLLPIRALGIMEAVLTALAAAHEAGLVHRDVKPENVLISDRGQIKVADFGLAKAISSQTSTATQGLLIGTVSYLPPELVTTGRADARSDVYSAGVVLFELLTGRKPHTGDTPIQVAYAHVHSDVPAVSSMAPPGRIPPYLDALVARATAREPEARPPDARVFLSELRRVRTSLQQGRADDPELTGELRRARQGSGAGRKADRTNYEATQRMTAPLAPAPEPRHYASPTVVDAPPPPVPRPVHAGAAERLAAQRDRQARKRRRGWIAFLVVLLLTAGAAATGWYLTAGRFTTAPALQMLSEDQATVLADKAGLRISFEDGYSETIATGLVISTDPSAGEKIVQGGQIHAVVSEGPERYAMPTVVGLSRDDASEALERAHLTVGSTRESYSDTVAGGLVISASETAGTKLRRGAAINLVISKGPRPVPITDYEGKPVQAAVTALKQAGFDVVVKSKHDALVPAGTVISQSPHSGTGVSGQQVTIVSSLGPVLVSVPNVRSMGVRAAEKVVQDAGFKTRVQPVSINYIGVGYVVFTNPRAGGQAPKGSTITLFVV